MNREEVTKIFQLYDGIMKTSELNGMGISKYEIKKLSESGFLEKILKGYYKLSNEEISDIRIISLLLSKFVLCLDSALFYYGYSDRTPREWHIAVNKDISKAKVRIDYPFIYAYYVEPYLLDLGVESGIIDGVEVMIYSRDRLICDCLKYEKNMDAEIFNKAIMSYIRDPKKNISKLMEYAKVRGVLRQVYDKIGTWL
jgi:predicted transcriptional regulator of viral defense system